MDSRRRVIVALGAGALFRSQVSLSQKPAKVWRIGFLAHRHIEFLDSDYQYGPFRQGMREQGYVDGKNLSIEWRSAEGNSARLPGLAAELAKLKLDVIVAGGTPATRAAQKATATIPIVMAGVADPIGSGFIESLARPGKNITGATNINVELGPKQMEILFGIVSNVSRVGVLINPSNQSHAAYFRGCQDGAKRLGIEVILPAKAQTPQELESAFAALAQEKAEALIVARDGFLNQEVRRVAALALRFRLPAIGGLREYVEAGGLISYGPSIREQFRRAEYYVARILQGAKPPELPAEQPMNFDLAVNLKTARALGVTVPPVVMVRATRVID